MLKQLKFKSSNYFRIGVASDFHAYHNQKFIYEQRGFDSVESHKNFILNNINNNFDKNSLLFYLGDLALNTTPEETAAFLKSLNTNIYYIWGNHESAPSKIYRSCLYDQEIEEYPLTWNNVTFVGESLTCGIDKQLVYFSHMAADIYPYVNHGGIHCLGHSHANHKDVLPSSNVGKRLDCGVDVALKYNGNCFFDWEEILDIMSKKDIKVLDRHIS